MLLLAVSGGVDSVVMTHLLWRLGFPIGIAHCNFHLRGASSDKDEALVREMAGSLNVPIYSQHFDTQGYAEQQGISLEMAARELRYAWFHQLLEAHGYQYLATAHHLNDQVETLLLNLTKGTGIKGLTAIQPIKGKTIRPLLFAHKEQLIQYAREYNLQWREDESNVYGTHQRNHIRHQVIPALKALNPSLEHTMADNIQHFRDIYSVWDREQSKQWQRLTQKSGQFWFINRPGLESLGPVHPYLFAFLSPFGFNKTQIAGIAEALDHQPGACFYAGTYQAEVARDYLVIAPYPLAVETLHFAEPSDSGKAGGYYLKLSLTDPANIDLKAPNHVFLDAEKLAFPLKLRPWEHGDRFYPLGMRNSKKLSDFFVDEQWPRLLKAQALVLCTANGTITWLLGSRLDERFKVTNKTKQVLMIYYEALN